LKPDTTIIPGDVRKPAAVFIHGLGMNKKIWECPDEARVLGGRYPLRLFLYKSPRGVAAHPGKMYDFLAKGRGNKGVLSSIHFRGSDLLSFGRPPERLVSLFHDLRDTGYTVIAWSQRKPSAEMDVAVSELSEVISMYREYCPAGIILIGHSRGGLIARKYSTLKHERIRGLFTIATPHRGSKMAQWAGYLSPLAAILGSLLPESEKGSIAHAFKKIMELLSSRAVKELLPDSPFFKALNDGPDDGIVRYSFGGKDPTLFTFYRKIHGIKRREEKLSAMLRYRKVVSFPEILEKLIPARLFPEEMRRGKGDGLVSAESSRLPWAIGHEDFYANHVEILFNEKAREHIRSIIVSTFPG
jgi:pimeloyl-ACP methyl ester carboxylesterase